MLMEAQKGGIKRAHGDEQDAGTVGEDEHAAELHKKHLQPDTGDNNRTWLSSDNLSMYIKIKSSVNVTCMN